METIEYHTIDKTDWPKGPWQSEPDKRQWQDEETGYPCLIVRGPAGALCGYVGVAPGHPWHERRYAARFGPCPDDYPGRGPEELISVHGGLTYSKRCAKDDPEASSICHVPAPGDPTDVWWFGFDCAHACDVWPHPGMSCREAFEPALYRDVAYVTAECESLAQQLYGVEKTLAASAHSA